MSSLIGRSSRSNESGSPDHKKQRRGEEVKFDFKDAYMFGVIFVDFDSRVKVCLMNLMADKRYREIYVAAPKKLIFDFSVGWTFTVVDSKLFAAGGRFKHVNDPNPKGYPHGFPSREVYFCDLRDAFTTNNNSKSLEFKVAATLNSPKRLPLVVPYKDKIFFIANPCEEEGTNYTTNDTHVCSDHVGFIHVKSV